jgi:acyl carrier protein
MSAIRVDVVRAAVSKVMDLPLDLLVGSTPFDDIGVDSIARIVIVDAILQTQPDWQIPAQTIKYSKTISEFADGITAEEIHG